MPQHDGLRTFAVGGVLWFHLAPVGRHFWGVSMGEMGVLLFSYSVVFSLVEFFRTHARVQERVETCGT